MRPNAHEMFCLCLVFAAARWIFLFHRGGRPGSAGGRRTAVLEESIAAIAAMNELYGSILAAPPSVGSRAEFNALPLCPRSALRRVYIATVDSSHPSWAPTCQAAV